MHTIARTEQVGEDVVLSHHDYSKKRLPDWFSIRQSLGVLRLG